MSNHWRPSLGLVIGGGLLGTLLVSLLGLVALRYLGPEFGFRTAAMGLALCILAGTGLLGWLMIRLLLRPIEQLKDYAAGHEAGHAAPRPRHFGTQEIRQTAEAVMSMTEALRDREATIRSFSDHVVHELKTPISAIRAAAELLEDEAQLTPDGARLLQQITGARQQIETQLAALRSLARARETRYIGQTKLVSALESLQEQFPELTLHCAGSTASLPLSAEGLRVVLFQLMRNAREHGANRIEFSCDEGVGGVSLTVTDNGEGISSGHATRVFEPFFTSRREAGGTGMGLTIVRNILKAHGAQIEVMPATSGACFRISF